MNRQGEYGRVKVWDTESWVANSDDRVAGVIASMRAMGQDRAAGIYAGNRKDFDIPSGNRKHNVQIAFNAIPPEKKAYLQHPAGTMPRFCAYFDTDYEFALNQVGDAYGGGAFELAAGRSVSKQNPLTFHNDWSTHWANEVEFALEKK